MADADLAAPAERAKKSDLPVRLASAVIMLAVATAAIAVGGRVFQTFVVFVALAAFVEFVLLVVKATPNVAFRLAAIIAGIVARAINRGRTTDRPRSAGGSSGGSA